MFNINIKEKKEKKKKKRKEKGKDASAWNWNSNEYLLNMWMFYTITHEHSEQFGSIPMHIISYA